MIHKLPDASQKVIPIERGQNLPRSSIPTDRQLQRYLKNALGPQERWLPPSLRAERNGMYAIFGSGLLYSAALAVALVCSGPAPNPLPADAVPERVSYSINQNILPHNDDGRTRFSNPFSYLSAHALALVPPTAIGCKTTTYAIDSGALSAAVPYRFARQFADDPNARIPIDPEMNEQVAKAVLSELNKQLKDSLTSSLAISNAFRFCIGDADYLTRGSLAKNLSEITSVEIMGTASPEGHEAKGPASIIPGNIDLENIRLSAIRAQSALAAIKKALADASGRSDLFRNATIKVNFAELQFSDEEIEKLDSIASRTYPIVISKLDRIFRLISDYNTGKFDTIDSIKGPMDQIVASKRAVSVKIGFKGKVQRTTVIPVLPPSIILIFSLLVYIIYRLDRWTWYK